MTVKIAPSLLSADFGALGAAATTCHDAGAEYLHFDVMDGLFVPNITFGFRALQALRGRSDAFFDAHLMIQQPERYVREFVKAGANGVTVQAEACTHLQRTLALIREAGGKAGLALNPATPLSVLDYVLDDIDLLLVMTVNPGFGGQEFIPAMMRKVREARAILDTADHPIELEVDGGVDEANAHLLVAAGATVLVSGTAIFGAPGGVPEGVRILRDAANRGRVV